MNLDSLQLEAVNLCLDFSKRIVAVTGAAGTGKTTIIKEVVKRIKDKGMTYAVCAPTGKAARRISQVTGEEAITIHRLLEYPRPGERDPETGKALAPGEPKRGHDNPLLQQVVIADEYMMVSHELDRNLIDALNRGARLLVFGDVYQLPPIDDGKVTTETQAPFEKHIDRASIKLEHVYRQGEGSGILQNANRIRKGSVPSKSEDFQISFQSNPVNALKTYVVTAKEGGVDFGSLEHQIIVPARKTWIGTNALNPVLRRVLNPDAEFELELPRNTWDKEHRVTISVGDKVVCTENSYDMRDYSSRYSAFNDKGEPIESSYIPCPPTFMMLNGETGIVTTINDDGSFEIDFSDRVVTVPVSYMEYNWSRNDVYDLDPRKRIDLAYALTTHKCQGSEYKRVIYVMNKSCGWMLGRRNFYTGVTRAREHVLVVTDPISISKAIKPEVKR